MSDIELDDDWGEDGDVPVLNLLPEEEPEGAVIRVGIVNDFMAYMGKSPDEEREEIIRELRAPWGGGLNAKLVWSAERPDFRDIPEVDLLIVDYGALWQSGDVVEDYTRRVREWADEHPGRLVVIWTSFTVSIYKQVFEEEFRNHAFERDPEYPDICKADVRAFGGDCGLREDDPRHTEQRAMPAANVILRRESDFGLDSREIDTFWPSVRSWLGYPEVTK